MSQSRNDSPRNDQLLNALRHRTAHLPGVQCRLVNELIAIDVSTPDATATVLLQGAQLIAYTQHNEQPLIWQSPLASFKRGASLRGGIPVCWPWFGDAARNPHAVSSQLEGETQPAHGFVRGLDWQLDAISPQDDDALLVTLSLTTESQSHPSWPFASRLVVTHRIGQTLETQLCVENRDTRAFVFSAALHTYFAVSDIDAVSIHGFDATRYIDALDDWATKAQQGDIVIDREVDRIYLGTPPRSVIRDAHWQRDIIVDAIGSRSAVVWNPWTEKALRLSDFAPDAYRHMLCIETANVMDDVIALAPGNTHRLGVAIHQQSCAGMDR